MKKNKTALLYFIASIAFFISATINFSNSGNGMGATHIALGATFLCLGIESSKDKKCDNENKKEDE